MAGGRQEGLTVGVAGNRRRRAARPAQSCWKLTLRLERPAARVVKPTGRPAGCAGWLNGIFLTSPPRAAGAVAAPPDAANGRRAVAARDGGAP